ncbi:hypothetical protein RTP6_007046 [Batrachochytrium dendrobatidis]
MSSAELNAIDTTNDEINSSHCLKKDTSAHIHNPISSMSCHLDLRTCLNDVAILAGSSHALLPVSKTAKPKSFAETLALRLNQVSNPKSKQLDCFETLDFTLTTLSKPEPAAQAECNLNLVKARYVRSCLNSLEAVDLALKNDSKESIDGFKDRSAIETLMPIIICWGIVPSLDSYSSKMIQLGFKLPQGPNAAEAASPINPLDTFLFGECLATMVRILLSERASYLVDLLRRKYLAAALLCAIAIQTETISTHHSSDQCLESNNGFAASALDIKTTKACMDSTDCKEFTNSCFSRLGIRLCMDALLSLLARLPNYPPCPAWLRSTVSAYLSLLIMKNNGVQALITLLLPMEANSDMSSTPTISQLEHVTRLLLTPPTGISKQVYFVNLSKQLCDLITAEDTGSKTSAITASFTISRFVIKSPSLGTKLFINPIVEPLMRFFYKNNSAKGTIISTSLDLEASIRSLERLISGCEPSHSLAKTLEKVIPILYYMYEKAAASKLAIQSTIAQILDTYFKLSDTKDVTQTLYDICICPANKIVATISHSDHGGIEFTAFQKENFDDGTGQALLIDPEFFCMFISKLDNSVAVGELFLLFLQGSLIAKKSDTLLIDEMNTSLTSKVSMSSADFAHMQHAAMIIAMMNTFGDKLLHNTSQILKFIKNTLLESDVDGISLALTLLKEIFTSNSVETDPETKQTISEIKIIIHTLTLHENEAIQRMTQDVRTTIFAHSDSLKSDTSEQDATLRKQSQDFKHALKELADPLLPIRAHGMAIMRQLVLDRAPVSKEHLDSIITIFLDMLEDQDSFIYLNAVKGLSTLTDVYASETLLLISKRYTDKSLFDMDYRLRIGEALMQTIQRSGQVFPKHASVILPAVLVVMRDTEKEMRASALSLMSRIAETAPLSLIPFIEQITDYVVTALQLEKEAEARRGSVVVIISLVRALGHSTIQVLSMKLVQKLRRQLQYSNESDSDSLTRQHAQLALEDFAAILPF